MAYNHERYVAEQLASVLAQMHADFEVVFLDDGSTDRTLRVVRERWGGDPRVRIHAQENAGIVAARNRAVALTRGEFVSILDSDDIIPPERAELQVAAFAEDPEIALVYGDSWIIDGDGRRGSRSFFELYPPGRSDFSAELFLSYCFTPANTVMFRRSAFERSGPFWGPGQNTDYLKWIELGLVGRARCLKQVKLGCWRRHGANASAAASVESRVRQYMDLRAGLEELLRRHPDFAARLPSRRVSSRLARCHFMAGFYAAFFGAHSRAAGLFREAIAIDPRIANRLALLSTRPGWRMLARPLYRHLGRKYLAC